MGLALTNTKLHGWNFAGFAFGVRYRFNDAFRAGLLYRTKVVVDLEGDTKSTVDNRSTTSRTTSEYPVPHTIKLGAELRLLDRRLVLAADFSIWVFKESHPRNVMQGRPDDWSNSVRFNMGGEYTFHERIAVRAGFYVGNSATGDAAATSLSVPPDVLYAVSAGAGVRLRERFDLDFALAYNSARNLPVSAPSALAGGTYGGHAVYWGISLSYGI